MLWKCCFPLGINRTAQMQDTKANVKHKTDKAMLINLLIDARVQIFDRSQNVNSYPIAYKQPTTCYYAELRKTALGS